MLWYDITTNALIRKHQSKYWNYIEEMLDWCPLCEQYRSIESFLCEGCPINKTFGKCTNIYGHPFTRWKHSDMSDSNRIINASKIFLCIRKAYEKMFKEKFDCEKEYRK